MSAVQSVLTLETGLHHLQITRYLSGVSQPPWLSCNRLTGHAESLAAGLGESSAWILESIPR
jgi:hypothetical protein